DAALDAHAVAVADHAETRSAVVVAPGEPRRRPGSVDIALIGVDGRRIERHQLRHVLHPAAEEPAEMVTVPLEDVLAVAPQAEVDVAARARLRRIRLRHEGDAHAGELGDFLHALLEDDMAIGHVERFGVAHVELVLAVAPFAFRSLDGDAGPLQVPAHRAMEALGARALEDVIVLEVPAGGFEVAVTLLRRVAIA